MIRSNLNFRRIIVSRIIIFTVLALVLLLIYGRMIANSNATNSQTGQLINVLGRQRMLTQEIAKDANRLYVLIQAVETGTAVSDPMIIEQAKSESRQMLRQAIDEFEEVVNGIFAGEIVVADEIIDLDISNEEIDKLRLEIRSKWHGYRLAAETIAAGNTIDSNMGEAIVYINANNMQLLDLSESLTNMVIDQRVKKTDNSRTIAQIIMLLSLLSLFVGMVWLYQFVILPLDELYQQLSITGLESRKRLKRFFPATPAALAMTSEVRNAFERLRSLIKLIENVNQNVSFQEVLEFIYDTFSAYIPYSYIGIALLKDNDTVLEASYGIGGQELSSLRDKLEGMRVDIDITSLADILNNNQARIINDYQGYMKDREIREYSRHLLDAGVRSSITLPLTSNEKQLGLIFFSSTRKNVYNHSHLAFLQTIANSIGISFEKSIFIDQLLYSSILAMARLTEARDEDTGDHLERIKHYTRTVALWLREAGHHRDILNQGYIDDLARFSPLHDIGKVGIRDGILLKPGKLTTEEFEEMKKHTDYGANVLNVAEQQMKQAGRSLFKIGIEIVSSHHEKWNGSGYPRGLKGEGIPLAARIVAVADVFDALTSKRPYKEEFSFSEAIRIMTNGRGSHFDPVILDVFTSDLVRLEETYHVIRSKSESLSFGT